MHHLHSDQVEAILKKYYVRDTTATSNQESPRFTFKEGGLFKTLKTRVAARLGTKIGPTAAFERTCIATTVAWAAAFSTLCLFPWTILAVATGVLLHGIMGVGHNYFHKGDKSKMRYVFDFTLFSHHSWRITHALVSLSTSTRY